MATMTSEQHEDMSAMSADKDSARDCCEQSDLAVAGLSMFSCDSVCVAINFYVEIGDPLISKVPTLDTSPIDIDDGVLAGFASIDPRPPKLTLS